MMRILVTGAAGFIGHRVVRKLIERGDEVSALVRPGTPSEMRARVALEGVTVVEADLRDPAALERACDGVEAVIHLAAQVGVTDRESDIRDINVGGTQRLLEAAARRGVRRMIYVSSASVIGPVRTTLAGEETPFNPGNAYARSKTEAEQASRQLAGQLGLELAIVRPPWVYGPGDLRTLGFFQGIRARWPLPWKTDVRVHPVFVEDLAQGFRQCLEAFPAAAGGTYHLAGPAPVPMREIVPLVARLLGSRPPLHVPLPLMEAAATACDAVAGRLDLTLPLTRRRLAFFASPNAFSIERARRDFGYDPATSLEEGMRITLEWYRSQGLL